MKEGAPTGQIPNPVDRNGESARTFEPNLARYASIVGHGNPLPISVAARLISDMTGSGKHRDIEIIRAQLKNLPLQSKPDGKYASPDIFLFVHDRRLDRSRLRTRFGWDIISIPLAQRIVGLLMEPPNPHTFEIGAQIARDYPSLKSIPKNIPARYFIRIYESLIPPHERKRIEEGIRKYSLTPSDYAMLLLSSRGMTEAEMSRLLGIKGFTIKYANHTIYDKLNNIDGNNVYDRTQIVILAIGEGLFPPSSITRLPEASKVPLIPELSPREIEVHRCLTLGLSNSEIARLLGIAYNTAKNHVNEILKKLGCANRTRAMLVSIADAYARGVLPWTVPETSEGFPTITARR